MSLRLSVVSLLCLVFLVLVHGQTCPNQTGQRLFHVQSDQTETCVTAESISGFPALIEVTLEELETGLESGHFTSVDLVHVGYEDLMMGLTNLSRPTLHESRRSMGLSTVSLR